MMKSIQFNPHVLDISNSLRVYQISPRSLRFLCIKATVIGHNMVDSVNIKPKILFPTSRKKPCPSFVWYFFLIPRNVFLLFRCHVKLRMSQSSGLTILHLSSRLFQHFTSSFPCFAGWVWLDCNVFLNNYLTVKLFLIYSKLSYKHLMHRTWKSSQWVDRPAIDIVAD